MKLEITVAVYLDPYERPDSNLIKGELEILERIIGTKLTHKTINGRHCAVGDIEFSEFYCKVKEEILKRIDNMTITI